MEREGFRYLFREPFPVNGAMAVKIEEILTEDTPVPPAYENMYVCYIHGKMAFYQNDLQEYNKQMNAFNQTLDSFAKWYKQTNPLEVGVRFRRKW